MSTLAKIKTKKDKRISKRALSAVVGYVLLIVFAVIIGVIVYKWQKTYVPQDEYAACPEGASIFIINSTYDCVSNTFTFFIRNNGRFSLGGYFIYVKDNQEKTIATLEISNNNSDFPDPRLNALGINAVKLGIEGEYPVFITNNYFAPREEERETYNLAGINRIYSVEIVPIRWQNEDGKEVLASCKDAKITEEIYGCSADCVEDDELVCGERECGKVINKCYKEIECGSVCEEGQFCTSEGKCVAIEGCQDSCSSLGYDCGIHNICGANIDCDGCSEIPHGYFQCNGQIGKCVITGCDYGWADCDGIYYNGCESNLLTDRNNCNSCGSACFNEYFCQNGRCLPGSTCDGIWELGFETPDVECDNPLDERCTNCVCDKYHIPDDMGGCKLDEASVDSCLAWCYIYGYDGRRSYCTNSEGHCESDPLRIYMEAGDTWCAEKDRNAKSCCCVPIGYVPKG